MGAEEERLVREFLHFGEGRSQNVDELTSRMAEDVVWQVNVPLSAVVVGREAARAEIERQNTISTGMLEGSEIRTVGSSGDTVFTERIDVCEVGGKRISFHINGIFEVRDGKIAAWREYFDTCDMAEQLGIAMGLDPKRLYRT
jgi:limonene-1,2-epoxide hydrolase